MGDGCVDAVEVVSFQAGEVNRVDETIFPGSLRWPRLPRKQPAGAETKYAGADTGEGDGSTTMIFASRREFDSRTRVVRLPGDSPSFQTSDLPCVDNLFAGSLPAWLQRPHRFGSVPGRLPNGYNLPEWLFRRPGEWPVYLPSGKRIGRVDDGFGGRGVISPRTTSIPR